MPGSILLFLSKLNFFMYFNLKIPSSLFINLLKKNNISHPQSLLHHNAPAKVGQRPQPVLHRSLTTFGAVCQIVNRFNLYLKRVYIIYLTCSFAIIVPLLYAIMYTGSTWINLFSQIAFLFYYIFLIGYLSHIAGKVDPMADSSGYRLYRAMVCSDQLLKSEKLSLKFKVCLH